MRRRQAPPVLHRFMDDIVLLAPTRWQLRRGEGSQPNAGGTELREAPGHDLHRRIKRGFDFLAYHFTREGLRVEILVWYHAVSVDRASQ